MSQERGFVLNTGEFEWDSCLDVCQGLQLVTSTDILIAMADDKGPNHSLVALGYMLVGGRVSSKRSYRRTPG